MFSTITVKWLLRLKHYKTYSHTIYSFCIRLKPKLLSLPMGKSIGTPEHKKLLVLLRRKRLDAGLRQEDLAQLLGKPQPYVSRYESGERRLDLLELREICVALRVTLTDFVREFEKTLSVRVRRRPTIK